jgi:cytochrome c-type biogenesis protein CcmH/NrfF
MPAPETTATATATSMPSTPAAPTIRRPGMPRWMVLSYALLLVVVVTGLVIGGRGDGGPRTPDERMHALAETIKCPTCLSQSVATSDAPASTAIKAEMQRQISEGRSDGEIRGFLVSKYGQDILLTPSSSGVAGLVWVLPVAALIVAVGGVVFAFRRWKRWA